MERKITYKIEQLNNALDDFNRSLTIDLSDLDSVLCDVVKSGHIQKFEFTIELLWKTIKSFLLEIHGFDEKSPKMTIKRFYSLEYLTDNEYEQFMDFIDDRNSLSHTYNKKQFEEIYERVIKSNTLFNKILVILLAQSSL